MNNEKKLAIKRLVLFFAIAFIPFAAVSFALKAYYGENIFASEKAEVLLAAQAAGSLLMLTPAIAALITRLVTKEGFKDSYLGFSPKGKWKYYLISVFLKPIEAVIETIAVCLIFLKGMNFAEIVDTSAFSGNTATYFMQIAISIILFFPAFGEEWGWRGYMMPKLIELMGKPAAIIVGGIIWGLWHAPLTVQGHNFGVDYPGYPFVGIALMCVFCVAMNAVLTWLTERTGSIYPASFCHMINNNCGSGVIVSYFFTQQALEKLGGLSQITMFVSTCGITLITGAVCFILLCKKAPAKAAE